MRKSILLLWLIPATLSAGTESVGTTSAAFVKLGSGSRPASLGEAYVALADDASGISYNPAGMSQMLNSEIQATHTEWFQGLRFENLNAVFSMGDGGMVGATFNFLSIPTLTRTEQIANTSDPALNFIPTGQFTPFDMQFALAYSRPLYPGILAGANLKVLTQNIDDRSTLGLGLDLGSIVATGIKGLTLGASFQNLGTPIKLKREAFGLPMLLRFGGAYRMLQDKLTFLLEGDLPLDNAPVVSLGVELAVAGRFYPRLGFRYNSIFNPWSVGLGMKFNQASLDLAMVPFGELGLTYRASISYRFGEPKLSIQAPQRYLSTSSGKPLQLQPKVSAPDKVTAWVLDIYDSSEPPRLVKEFKGTGAVPREVLWDGRTDRGGMAQPTLRYSAAISVTYVTGKQVRSDYLRDIEIVNTAPQVGLKLEPESVDARGPNQAFIPVALRPVIPAGRAIARWRLEVVEIRTQQVFYSHAEDGTPPDVLRWDGKGNKGDDFISNQFYFARILVVDTLGNQSWGQLSSPFRAVFRQ